jgi:hypothetical protein
MHFVWKSDFENDPCYTRASVLNAREFVGVKLTSGLALADSLPEIKIGIESEYPVSDYFNVGPFFVVSERLRALFDKANAAVEYHLVTLSKNGQFVDNKEPYYFANLLEKVDCFDFEKSIYTLDDGFVDTIKLLEIDESKANGKILFRIDRAYDIITLVNQDLHDLVLAEGVTGVKFYTPTDWRW